MMVWREARAALGYSAYVFVVGSVLIGIVVALAQAREILRILG